MSAMSCSAYFHLSSGTITHEITSMIHWWRHLSLILGEDWENMLNESWRQNWEDRVPDCRHSTRGYNLTYSRLKSGSFCQLWILSMETWPSCICVIQLTVRKRERQTGGEKETNRQFSSAFGLTRLKGERTLPTFHHAQESVQKHITTFPTKKKIWKQLEKDDYIENLHVLSCFVLSKSVLLISCVLWIPFPTKN